MISKRIFTFHNTSFSLEIRSKVEKKGINLHLYAK